MLDPLRLLLPNSRLWLPGMRVNPLGRFGVCTNCCEVPWDCVGCATGTGPNSVEVTISSVINGLCTGCVGYNDTFICTAMGGQDACRYQYDGLNACSGETYCIGTGIHVMFGLQLGSLFGAAVCLSDDSYTLPNYRATPVFWKAISSPIDCGFDGYSLDPHYWYGAYYGLLTPSELDALGVTPCCNIHLATCTITAV